VISSTELIASYTGKTVAVPHVEHITDACPKLTTKAAIRNCSDDPMRLNVEAYTLL
jgi:hypothetical protein